MKTSLDNQIDKYEEIIAQNPEDLGSLMLYADANFKRGKKLAALSSYQKIVKIDPDNLKAKNAIARIYLSQKMINEAYKEILRVLDADINNVEARFLFAQLQKQNVPLSEEILVKFNNLPDFHPSLEQISDVLDGFSKQRDELEAYIKDYQEMLNSSPDDILLEFDIQMCLKRKVTIEEIITFARQIGQEEERLRVEEEERLRVEEEERLRIEEEERLRIEEERLRVEEEERLRVEEEERLRVEEEERLRVEEEERFRVEEEERLKREEEERLKREEEERLKREEEERLKREEEERLKREEEERLKREEEERLKREEEERLKREEEKVKNQEMYKKLGEIFASTLQDFSSNKMVSEVLLVDINGLIVKRAGTPSDDKIGNIVAEGFTLVRTWKSMEYWVIEYQQGLIFTKLFARGLILVVNGGIGSNLGALKIIIDKNEKELIKALRLSEFASLLDGN